MSTAQAAPTIALSAEAVLRRRIELGLTQKEVARRAGLSKQFVCDIERGRRQGSTATRKSLAAALGVEVLDLHVTT